MKKLTRTICLTLAVLLGSTGTSWGADFDKGVAAYESGDFATALREWRPLAKQGNAVCPVQSGWDVRRSDEVFHRIIRPRRSGYRLAAEQGDAGAQFNLGGMYDSGEGVPQDYKTAAKWYRLAAEQGDADSQQQSGFDVRERTRCSTGL